MTRIYLVDDQHDVLELWHLLIDLANAGLVVAGESSAPDQALITDDAVTADVLVTDQMMPGMTGLELIAALRERGFTGVTVLCSAFVDPALEDAARALGVDVCLPKASQSQLPDVIRTAAA